MARNSRPKTSSDKVKIIAVLAVLALAACNCPAPIEPKCFMTDSEARRSIFWPTLSGSPQCPLPADHPKCIAGTDPYCQKP